MESEVFEMSSWTDDERRVRREIFLRELNILPSECVHYYWEDRVITEGTTKIPYSALIFSTPISDLMIKFFPASGEIYPTFEVQLEYSSEKNFGTLEIGTYTFESYALISVIANRIYEWCYSLDIMDELNGIIE